MSKIIKPSIIEINEVSAIAFSRAAALIQQGYQFSPYSSPETFATGQATITLVLGESDEEAIAGAAESLKYALEHENLKLQQDKDNTLAATEAEQQRLASKAAIEVELLAAQNLVRRLSAAAKRT